MNNNFKFASPNGFQEILAHLVALLRNDVKGSFDRKTVVQVHQRSTCVPAHGGFHIVGHHGATWSAVGPKPDKRDAIYALRFEGQKHDLFEDLIHTAIYRPMRERQLLPPAQAPLLHMLSDAHRQ